MSFSLLVLLTAEITHLSHASSRKFSSRPWHRDYRNAERMEAVSYNTFVRTYHHQSHFTPAGLMAVRLHKLTNPFQM